jgi:hypothetical protein
MKDSYRAYHRCLDASRAAARRGDHKAAAGLSRRAERERQIAQRSDKAPARSREGDETFEEPYDEEAHQAMKDKLDDLILAGQREIWEKEAQQAAAIEAQEEADAAWARLLFAPPSSSP